MIKRIGQIEVKIDDRVFVIDGDVLTKIDYLQIKEHLLKYAGDFAWVASTREVVVKQLAYKELELEEMYSTLDISFRKQSGCKEREIKSYIYSNEDYKRLGREAVDLRYQADRLKAVVTAMGKMESTLIQLSTMAKREEQ